jgi:hypothetical protein
MYRSTTRSTFWHGQAHAQLRDQGVAGIELQLFRSDDFANGRLYHSLAAALEASAVRRQQMIEKGWRDSEHTAS